MLRLCSFRSLRGQRWSEMGSATNLPAPLIVAVDPGLSGAIAFLRGPDDLTVEDMPVLEMKRNGKAKRDLNYAEIGRLFDCAADADALWVERVGAMIGQGTSSCFTFGKVTGAIIGAAAANFWRIHEVPPVTWRRAVGLKPGRRQGCGALAGNAPVPEALGTVRQEERRRAGGGSPDRLVRAYEELLLI